MRYVIFGAVLAMAFLFSFVKVAIQPQALKQDWQPSSADLSHPPSTFGATAVVAAPREPRH